MLFSRCAQVAPLTGGKRDFTPPKVLKSIPENAALNFNSSVIEITFDEFVQLKDISNNVVITPQPKEFPTIEASGKKITITFKEKLNPNTTYRLFFGKAIADMHESNVLANYEYVFSTGNFIDSLKISGQVVNALSLKGEADVLVGLYSIVTSDSAIYLNKPDYLTKTNESGQYTLRYLPKNTFEIVAFTDKNKNLLFDSGEEWIGFIDKQVSTEKDSLVNLSIFKEDNSKQFIKRAISPYYGFAYVVLNREQKSNVVSLNQKADEIVCTETAINDTCFVYYNNVYDTLKLTVINIENQKKDTLSVIIQSKEKVDKLKNDKKLKLELADNSMNSGAWPFYLTPEFKFSNPVTKELINEKKISFYQLNEDTNKVKLPFEFEIKACNSIKLLTKMQPATKYELIFLKGAFTGITGAISDSIKLTFKTSDPEEYANLVLKVQLPDKNNYMLQLLNEKGLVIKEEYIEQSIASSINYAVQFKNLIPGNYFAKLYKDENKNKTWDTGSFLNKKHAELIFLNTIPIKLLSNWDSETEWIVK